jgi:glycosyltransferase involved in cell wall biosynthesis
VIDLIAGFIHTEKINMSYKVMMLGTDMSTKGGVASVIKDYLEYGILERLGISYVATHRDGSKISKLLFFSSQFLVISYKMLFSRIVHIHSSQGWSYRRLFILFLMAKIYGKKTVWHIHGSQFDIYYKNATIYEKYLIRFGLRKADKVIALSLAWKEKLQIIESNASIIVILNAVNTKKYEVVNRQLHSPMTVLFLGRLGKRKGVYDILKAIEILAKENIYFILAGDGEINEVLEIINKKGLEKIVEVPGWTGDEKKKNLIKKSDVYILPSYNEGLPISILEAMAASLPIISTPVGGIPDAVIDGENGYLIEPGNFKALASKILKIYQDHILWRKLSVGSQKIAIKKYDTSRIELELTGLYKELS